MVKLKQEYKENSIPVSELKDGQIGVITEWNNNDYIGIIIQRAGIFLFSLGGLHRWESIPIAKYCRVRVLENGTELIITNNK